MGIYQKVQSRILVLQISVSHLYVSDIHASQNIKSSNNVREADEERALSESPIFSD